MEGMATSAHRPRRRLRRVALGAVVLVIVAGVVGWRVLTSSPEPGALIMRDALDGQSVQIKASMANYAATVPATRDVWVAADQPFRDEDPEALLDVYSARDAQERGSAGDPTIVWLHGGGWLGGNKADWAPYFKLLAARGFTVVSVGYSLSPEHQYPQPTVETNAALAYLVANAERLHVDPDRFFLAGDSAGAQVASQTAAAITDPAYARDLEINPAIEPSRLRGVILHSGVFDAAPFVNQEVAPGGPMGFAVATLLWAYAGTKDWDSPLFDQMSTIDHVTARFPPAFITGGNDDPLTKTQSRPFAAKLQSIGVPTETTFFPAAYRPKLGHEFQFDFAFEESATVLAETVAFVRRSAG